MGTNVLIGDIMHLPTEQELYNIREYMFLPMVLTILDKDKKAISYSDVKFKQSYLDMIEEGMKRVNSDLLELRKGFLKAGIIIAREERLQNELYWQYKCRGHIGEGSMLWDFVKAEIQVRINKYLNINRKSEKKC